MTSQVIALGMKVSVRRGGREQIGVVTRLEGEHVIVRWVQTQEVEPTEYQALRDEVTPLMGWI
jgi:hypothetical protein